MSKLDVELLEHEGDPVRFEVHDGVENLEDRVEDEHDEGTLEVVSIGISALGGPLASGTVVAPELEHHLVLISGELTKRESPSVETRPESDSTLLRVDLDVTESGVVVGRDDDVEALDDTREGLLKVLLRDLKLEKCTVDLVDDDDRLDTLGKCLTKHGLGLYADALKSVNYNKGSIGDTEGSSDFRREVDVFRRVDQVVQEISSCRQHDRELVINSPREENQSYSRSCP